MAHVREEYVEIQGGPGLERRAQPIRHTARRQSPCERGPNSLTGRNQIYDLDRPSELTIRAIFLRRVEPSIKCLRLNAKCNRLRDLMGGQ